jgi:transposase-like protein
MASPLSADADPEQVQRARAAIACLELAEAAVEAARLERDEAIVAMLEKGVSLGRVARHLGMSRALVQQTRMRVTKARARSERLTKSS